MTTALQSADPPPRSAEQLCLLRRRHRPARRHRLDPRHRPRPPALAQWHGHQLHPALAPGEGCYNFVLNAQGHIQGDLTAFLLEDSILLETSRDQIAKLLAHLNHFIIMDDVELADITAQRHGLLIAGPDAGRLLAAIGLSCRTRLLLCN